MEKRIQIDAVEPLAFKALFGLEKYPKQRKTNVRGSGCGGMIPLFPFGALFGKSGRILLFPFGALLGKVV